MTCTKAAVVEAQLAMEQLRLLKRPTNSKVKKLFGGGLDWGYSFFLSDL